MISKLLSEVKEMTSLGKIGMRRTKQIDQTQLNGVVWVEEEEDAAEVVEASVLLKLNKMKMKVLRLLDLAENLETRTETTAAILTRHPLKEAEEVEEAEVEAIAVVDSSPTLERTEWLKKLRKRGLMIYENSIFYTDVCCMKLFQNNTLNRSVF